MNTKVASQASLTSDITDPFFGVRIVWHVCSYFIWQRSADDPGWRGNNHADDWMKLASGETRSLAMEHNQSGDLRKLPTYDLSQERVFDDPFPWNPDTPIYARLWDLDSTDIGRRLFFDSRSFARVPHW